MSLFRERFIDTGPKRKRETPIGEVNEDEPINLYRVVRRMTDEDPHAVFYYKKLELTEYMSQHFDNITEVTGMDIMNDGPPTSTPLLMRQEEKWAYLNQFGRNHRFCMVEYNKGGESKNLAPDFTKVYLDPNLMIVNMWEKSKKLNERLSTEILMVSNSLFNDINGYERMLLAQLFNKIYIFSSYYTWTTEVKTNE